MCENESERHEWRAEVLGFIRDHLDPTEVYRLAEADLEFGGLLPQKPGCVEQEEYEGANRVGFALERLAKHGRLEMAACGYLERDSDDARP